MRAKVVRIETMNDRFRGGFVLGLEAFVTWNASRPLIYDDVGLLAELERGIARGEPTELEVGAFDPRTLSDDELSSVAQQCAREIAERRIAAYEEGRDDATARSNT